MAGVLKARDTDGTVRTPSAIKVRDAAGTLQPLLFVRVRDAAGVLQEVFTAGGGGGGGAPANPTSITPGFRYFSGTGTFRSAQYVASSSGGAPSAYAWGVLNGNGTVTAGGTTATATLQIYADIGEYQSATFFCDMTIAGATYRATCTLEYQNIRSAPGGLPLA